MRAFKFRSAQNIEFALDIIINRRLFCADWKNLNDPMEGMFAYSTMDRSPEVNRIVKGIGNEKQRYKVCSLSADFQSHLLWSHYAGGFDGLAIEVELPDHHQDIRHVDYRGVFAFLDIDNVVNEDEAARRILFSKYQEWQYEEEIRVLSSEPFFELQSPIRRVITGHRMNPALLETLVVLCDREGIEICTVGVGDEGLDADHVDRDRLDRARRFRRTPQNQER